MTLSSSRTTLCFQTRILASTCPYLKDSVSIIFCSSIFIVSKEVDLSRCVPLIFHCDDGEAHRRRSFMVATFGSALVHGSPWDTRFLLYTTDNARSCSSTYDTLDSWIAWAFAELGTGQWLGHSPWGEVMDQRKCKEGALIADG